MVVVRPRPSASASARGPVDLDLWRGQGVVRTRSGAVILSRGRLSQVRQSNGVIELTKVDLVNTYVRLYVLHLVGVSFTFGL